MSIKTSCPECGHEFNVLEEYERFEELAAQMVNGTLAPKQTGGYDVIDRLGLKYQVKYSNLTIRSGEKYGNWGWTYRINLTKGDFPDFFILYGIVKSDIFCFLLSTGIFLEKSIIRHQMAAFKLSGSNSLSSWIWDYRVTPETFESKLNWLISISQFAMFLDAQHPHSRVRI